MTDGTSKGPGPASLTVPGIEVHLPCAGNASGPFTIIEEAGGSTGTIRVTGRARKMGVAADEVRARIYPISETPPASPPDVSATTLAATPNGNGDFTLNDLPGATCGGASRLAVWAKYGEDWVGPKLVDFHGECQPLSRTVSATACLWFAWAPDPTVQVPADSGGISHDLVGDHRPLELPVPCGARSVTIEATGNWQHGPNSDQISDANGRADFLVGDELLANYQDVALKSHKISALEAAIPCNKLLGMWQIAGGPDDPFVQSIDRFEIGTSLTGAVPPGARKLFLGMHDGREWNNNEDDVSVTISWSHD